MKPDYYSFILLHVKALKKNPNKNKKKQTMQFLFLNLV